MSSTDFKVHKERAMRKLPIRLGRKGIPFEFTAAALLEKILTGVNFAGISSVFYILKSL